MCSDIFQLSQTKVDSNERNMLTLVFGHQSVLKRQASVLHGGSAAIDV